MMGTLSRGYRWNSPPLLARDVIVVGSAGGTGSATREEGRAGRRPGLRRPDRPAALDVLHHPDKATRRSRRGKTIRGDTRAPAMLGADERGRRARLRVSADHQPDQRHVWGSPPRATTSSALVVCLDASTGRRVWHYQPVRHGLFDYDNPAAPILADVRIDGRTVKAVVQVTKQSFAYVLDRVSGAPVWPIEDRPVPSLHRPRR